MSKTAFAESALVEKLIISRNAAQEKKKVSPNYRKSSSPPLHRTEKTVKPPKPPSNDDEEIGRVLTLDVPVYDKSRTFEGIEKQKMAKKDRHMKALGDFAKILDNISENIEQNVLVLSRAVREDLELIDEELNQYCAKMKDDSYLVKLSRREVSVALDEMNAITARRSNVIESFNDKLEHLEVSRADTVGKEIKKLVDLLIAIAHQLPDEIEHIVETETFELNTVLTTNRKSHAELVGMMRTTQARIEIDTVHKWEIALATWRQLRHDQAIGIFHSDLKSARFTDPPDRLRFLHEVRQLQQGRHNRRQQAFDILADMNSDNISSATVAQVQQAFVSINEDELNAVQNCYNGLSELRANLRDSSEARMEALRRELHKYGALALEPEAEKFSEQIKAALNDPNLAELWRLGGGLKSDLQAVANDIITEDIYYEALCTNVHEKLNLIVCGFNLKEVLEERGRLPRLEAVRNMLSKLRTVPRAEVINVVNSLIPDIKEMSGLEKCSPLFRQTLQQCLLGMEGEVQRISELRPESPTISRMTTAGSMRDARLPTAASMKDARLATAASMKDAKLASNPSRLSMNASASKLNASASMRSVTSKTKRGRGGSTTAEKDETCVDPLLAKQWARLLGILYYGSDFSEEFKAVCLNTLAGSEQQFKCNQLIDAVVKNECDVVLNRLDSRYKKLIDTITTFLEQQTTNLSFCCLRTSEFFHKLAIIVEKHKAKQLQLDEISLDALWDYKEEFRLEREDREMEFQQLCNQLRKSAGPVELQENFELVLQKLQEILESYRFYHRKACYIADKHPLSLVDEFIEYLTALGGTFNMGPTAQHSLLLKHQTMTDIATRRNQRFLESQASAEAPAADAPVVTETEDASSRPKTAENATAVPQERPGTAPAPEPPVVLNTEGPFEVYFLIADSSHDTNATDDEEDDASAAEIGEKYGLTTSDEVFVKRFLEDSSKEEEDFNDIPMIQSSMSEDNLEVDGDIVQTHPEYPWLRVNDNNDVKMLTVDDYTRMTDEDIIDHENAIAAVFTPVPAEELTEEQREGYAFAQKIVENVRIRKEQAADPNYIKKNIPKDAEGNELVLRIEVTPEYLSSVISSLRQSLLLHLQETSNARLTAAEKLNTERKDELTSELEDRLRTHWPRSGEVETQIKRPREAELLGHEQKTYRFIQSIQEKMIVLQSKFTYQVDIATNCFKTYVENMSNLEAILLGTQFKTLASLQGVEVKARSTTQEFQATSSSNISSLRHTASSDIQAIISYARDFRKICPPQEEGKEGGYSEAEITEIGELVETQIKDIMEIMGDWNARIDEITQEESTTLQRHQEFTVKYDKVANDLALSEGLGQKYGAPRRRAQEKIRTEVARDEKVASSIDDLLQRLETIAADVEHSTETDDRECKSKDSPGLEEFQLVEQLWQLVLRVRTALHCRGQYLKIFSTEYSTSPDDIAWPPFLMQMGYPTVSTDEIGASAGTLEEVMNDVEAACRAETKQLYEAEGKKDMLTNTETGVPESLNVWLKETRLKILGPAGYHERAWKRLWGQVNKFEILLARKNILLLEIPQVKAGVPALSFRMLRYGYQYVISKMVERKVEQFSKSLKVWSKGRENHERMLRPRLGSPDAADELQKLDNIESERSNDLKTGVKKFQSMLYRNIIEISKMFVENLGLSGRAYLQCLDTSVQLTSLQVPPGIEMPRQKMTLKRLRKAQRIKENVEKGMEDTSVERVWPGVPVETLVAVIKASERHVSVEDITAAMKTSEPESPVTAPVSGKSTKVKASEKLKEAPSVEVPTTFVPASWTQSMTEKSSVRGSVTTAQRILIAERDQAMEKFASFVQSLIDANVSMYGTILSQEDSWHERWKRQVEMLRAGNL